MPAASTTAIASCLPMKRGRPHAGRRRSGRRVRVREHAIFSRDGSTCRARAGDLATRRSVGPSRFPTLRQVELQCRRDAVRLVFLLRAKGVKPVRGGPTGDLSAASSSDAVNPPTSRSLCEAGGIYACEHRTHSPRATFWLDGEAFSRHPQRRERMSARELKAIFVPPTQGRSVSLPGESSRATVTVSTTSSGYPALPARRRRRLNSRCLRPCRESRGVLAPTADRLGRPARRCPARPDLGVRGEIAIVMAPNMASA